MEGSAAEGVKAARVKASPEEIKWMRWKVDAIQVEGSKPGVLILREFSSGGREEGRRSIALLCISKREGKS